MRWQRLRWRSQRFGGTLGSVLPFASFPTTLQGLSLDRSDPSSSPSSTSSPPELPGPGIPRPAAAPYIGPPSPPARPAGSLPWPAPGVSLGVRRPVEPESGVFALSPRRPNGASLPHFLLTARDAASSYFCYQRRTAQARSGPPLLGLRLVSNG